MKMTIKTAFGIAAASIFISCASLRAQSASTPVQPATEQSERLQGTWEGVGMGQDTDGKCTLTITGNAIKFQGPNQDVWCKATFALAKESDPKQLIATITDCPQPDIVGKSFLAIFKIEEGKLTLVSHVPGAPDAPKSFEGDAMSLRFIFKKVEPQKQNTELPKSK